MTKANNIHSECFQLFPVGLTFTCAELRKLDLTLFPFKTLQSRTVSQPKSVLTENSLFVNLLLSGFADSFLHIFGHMWPIYPIVEIINFVSEVTTHELSPSR